MLINIPKSWMLPDSAATPKSVYKNRREFLKSVGLTGLGLATAGCFFSVDESGAAPVDSSGTWEGAHSGLYPVPWNDRYQVPERAVTLESLATMYNNYYEFTTAKDRVWELVDRFETSPWSVEIAGLVHRPQTIDFDTLVRIMPLEERLYRFRCVETWAATIPWSGFPFSALIDRVEPMSSARYVRMETVNRPTQMPGIDSQPGWPWPYYEGLTIEEAMNELAFLVTGAYGVPLKRQNGAPIRLAVPWKYGFKNIKSIVRIEFTDTQPATFWHTLQPNEYGFEANVDPNVPHPRWSQATEILLGSNERIPTQVYNGYGEYVASLY